MVPGVNRVLAELALLPRLAVRLIAALASMSALGEKRDARVDEDDEDERGKGAEKIDEGDRRPAKDPARRRREQHRAYAR